MCGSIPSGPPSWLVAELWNAGSGEAAIRLGGRLDHRPLTVENDETTAPSPSRETGSIGAAGLARTGLAWGDWQRISMELEMTALPMQKQPGWLRLQLEVP